MRATAHTLAARLQLTAPAADKRTVKRLLRLLLDSAAATSALICLATIILWPRSYRSRDSVGYNKDGYGRYTYVYSDRGHVAYLVWISADCGGCHNDSTFFGLNFATTPVTSEPAPQPPNGVQRFGEFAWLDARLKRRSYYPLFLQAPHWSVATLTGILPALRARRLLFRKSRHRAGLCPACGYDLRATPDRCPECGTPTTIAGQRSN